MKEKSAFSEFLDKAILDAGLTDRDVARLLVGQGYDIDHATIYRWRTGRFLPKPDKKPALKALGKVLQLTGDRLQEYEVLVWDLIGVDITGIQSSIKRRTRLLQAKKTYFMGREEELGKLQSWVSERRPVLMTGLGGIGKTSLACTLLQQHEKFFIHGYDSLELSRYESAVDVVNQVAQLLGVPEPIGRGRGDVRLIVKTLREAARGIDMLFLLDNVETAEQVEPLISGLPDITWVITSRYKLYFLTADPEYLELSPLLPSVAAQIFCHYARVNPDPVHLEQAEQIGERLGYWPIALRMAAGQVAVGNVADLAELHTSLVKRGIAMLKLETRAMTVFCEEILNMVTTAEVRDLFDVCGVFARPHIDCTILKEIVTALGLPWAKYSHLTALHLVQEENNHLSLHPLLHEFAAQRLTCHPRCADIIHQFTTCYAAYAVQNRGQYNPLSAEWENIWKAAHYALESHDWEVVQPFWGPVTGQLWRQSEWQAYRAFDEKCLALIRTKGDRLREGQVLVEIGWAYLEEEQEEVAASFFHQAKTIYDELEATEQAINIYRSLGILYTNQRQLDLATQFLSDAEAQLESVLAQTAESWAYSQLGRIYHAQAAVFHAGGQHEKAYSLSLQALNLCERFSTKYFLLMMRLRLGDICYSLKKVGEAVNIWEEVVEQGKEYKTEVRVVAGAKHRLAHVVTFQGNREKGLQLACEAYEIYARSGSVKKVQRMEAIITNIRQMPSPLVGDWPELEWWD